MESVYTKGNTSSSFQCKGIFRAAREDENLYSFTFEKKGQVLINGQAPQQIMDRIMLKMGKSLYPVQLIVSDNGELLSVENFAIISERWNREAQAQLSEQQNSPVVARYIANSRKNIENAEALKQSLMRDSLIKLLFCGLFSDRQDYCFVFENFPEREQKQSFICNKRVINDCDIILDSARSADGQALCTIRYLLGERQEINRISACISDAEKQCGKTIEIEFTNKVQSSKSWILFNE
ncbi:MAG: hypothetical protein LBJ63_02125 [Prevotellaceae bacterium]|jgi:hypothetical protein|nr:hypothetical protein [Prevotellaceae bacterium]